MKIIRHRDGDVTYWSVYRQTWVREHVTEISDREFAAMSDKERKLVDRHLTKHTQD